MMNMQIQQIAEEPFEATESVELEPGEPVDIPDRYIFSNNGFYPLSMKDVYLKAGSWPESGVEVDGNVFSTFTATPPPGKTRGQDENGAPVWVDLPLPTREELVLSALSEKQWRIKIANDYMNARQWPGKAAMGRLKETEKDQYNLWLDYHDALEAVDTSTAPNIEWPAEPEQESIR